MFWSPTETRAAKARRSDRIERIVHSVLQQERAGIVVDDSELERRFSKLMPELGENLRTARSIRAASEKANQPAESTGEGDASSEHDLRCFDAVLKDYEVLERLDHGGQGTVFRAVQASTGRIVAIKAVLGGPLSSQRQRHRFAREVELVSRLRHPNIVTLFESGEVQGQHFFAMEFVDGLPIDDFVLLHRLAIEECVRLFAKTCRAISHAHQRGVIHRDLKPSNILVDLDGEPHILDFGLAKSFENVADGGKGGDSLSITGQVFGTLPYLSPEQASGLHEDVDVRSDVYALGVLLYQLLTGIFPYPVVGDPVTVRANILTRDPASLRQVVGNSDSDIRPTTGTITDDLERIVLKALAKDQSRRYQSVNALADDLDRYLAGDAVVAKADSSLYILKKTLRKYRVHVAIGAAFVALLGVSSVVVTAQWLKARTDRDNARQIALIAHSTLAEVIKEFEGSIRPLAGGTKVRDRLLGAVAIKLDRLRPLVESDVEMEGLLATLREKQGDITEAQGRHADAADHYRASLDIYQRRADTEISGDLAQLDVARVHRKLGGVSGNADGHYGQAIDILEAILGYHPDAIEAGYELGKALIEFGQRLYDTGRYERAEAQADAAFQTLKPMSNLNIDDWRWNELLSTAHGLHGRAQLKLGKRESAIKSLEEYLRLRTNLSEMRPADVVLRDKLLLACNNVGDLYRDDGRTAQAQALFEQAMRIGEYLVLVDPSVSTWKRDLYSVHDKLARLFLKTGNAERAEAHLESAVGLVKNLAETEPQNAKWRRLLAFSYLLRGNMRFSKEQYHDAHEDYHKAVTIREELSADDPGNSALKAELATGLHWLGKCAKHLGQSERALTCWRRAHDVRRVLHNHHPNVTNHTLSLIASQTTLAEWHIERNSPEDDQTARGYLADAAALLDELRNDGSLAGRGELYTEWMSEIKSMQDRITDRLRAGGSRKTSGAWPSNRGQHSTGLQRPRSMPEKSS